MPESLITANSPQELVEVLKKDLLRLKTATSISRKEIWERLQMDHFLLGVADSWAFGFPVQIGHTSDRNPDFVIAMPQMSIGVECSRIMDEKIGWLTHLQQSGKVRSAISQSPFLLPTGPMKEQDLVNAATGNSQFLPLEWGDPKGELRFWIRCAKKVLMQKTAAMDRPDYQPCDQYWLVLMDGMSGDRHEIQRRVESLHNRLTDRCQKREKWFSRIVVQDQSLDWHVEVTKDGVTN